MRQRCGACVILLALSLALPAVVLAEDRDPKPAPAAAPTPDEPAAPVPLDGALLSFVVTLGGTPHVAIARGIPATWADGPPVVLTREAAGVRRPAAVKALPAEHAAWAGRALTVFGKDGAPRCRATVADLHTLVWYEPHFGTVNRWNARDDEGPAPDDAAVVQMAEELGGGDGDRFLVGRLVPEDGAACDGAVWARAADRPLPSPAVAASDPDPGLREAALKRFRGQDRWKQIQAEYREHPTEGKGKRWDEHGGVRPAVRVLKGPGDVRWVWVGVDVNEGCGGFFADLWTIWEVRGAQPARARWTVLGVEPPDGLWFEPLQAVDLDGDGRPEFVGPDDLVRPVGPTWQRVETVEPNSYDCPC